MKLAKELQAGDKVRRRLGGEVVTLIYAGRAAVPGVVLLQWAGRLGDNWAHVSPYHEVEVV
jgi:hypothetical protein